MADLTLTSAVCSKLLHDLAGPVGAVLNGAELLAEGAKGLSPADIAALLKGSAEQLNAQIQAYRIAFGAMSGGAEVLPLEEVKGALEAYARYKGFGAAFTGGAAGIHKDLAKLLFNAAFILGEGVRKRGALAIALGERSLSSFSVTAKAERITLDADAVAALRGTYAGAASPGVVSGLYAREVAKAIGASLALEEKPGEARLTAAF